MGISDLEIYRIYQCSNKDCSAKIGFQQKASDKWKKRCPCCRKHTLIIYESKSNISINSNTSAKTIGMLAEKNSEYKYKHSLDLDNPSRPKDAKIPFWRKSRKVNFDILRNPKSYVERGIY